MTTLALWPKNLFSLLVQMRSASSPSSILSVPMFDNSSHVFCVLIASLFLMFVDLHVIVARRFTLIRKRIQHSLRNSECWILFRFKLNRLALKPAASGWNGYTNWRTHWNSEFGENKTITTEAWMMPSLPYKHAAYGARFVERDSNSVVVK